MMKWVVDNTIGWLIDKVMNELNLRRIVDDFINGIKEELGINKLQKDVTSFMTSSLTDLTGSLQGVNINSIQNGVKTVSNLCRKQSTAYAVFKL